jgi:hypothetical protein
MSRRRRCARRPRPIAGKHPGPFQSGLAHYLVQAHAGTARQVEPWEVTRTQTYEMLLSVSQRRWRG